MPDAALALDIAAFIPSVTNGLKRKDVPPETTYWWRRRDLSLGGITPAPNQNQLSQ